MTTLLGMELFCALLKSSQSALIAKLLIFIVCPSPELLGIGIAEGGEEWEKSQNVSDNHSSYTKSSSFSLINASQFVVHLYFSSRVL